LTGCEQASCKNEEEEVSFHGRDDFVKKAAILGISGKSKGINFLKSMSGNFSGCFDKTKASMSGKSGKKKQDAYFSIVH
jgi:hypothetical protein